MVKFVMDRPGAPWDYPTLGFSADADGAILDGTLFTPDLTIPPDAHWTVYGGGSAETDITRYSTPAAEYIGYVVPEPVEGFLLAYDPDLNTYTPQDPADLIATAAWDTTLSASYARGRSVTDPAFGADPTGVADSTAAIQAAINSAGSTATMRAAKVFIPAGEYKITSTLLIDRKNIDLEGAGIGGSGGGGTVLRWAGAAGVPMIRVTKSWGTHIHDMRIAGKSTAKPSALISFYNITGDPNGNSHNNLSRLWLGAFEGYDTDDAEQMDYGLLFEGDNTNNDQSRFSSIVIHQPALAGVKVTHTQSMFLHFDDLYVYYSGGDGVQCSGRISGSNWHFNANAGNDLVIDSAGHIRLMDFGSEGSGGLALIDSGDLSIDSGYFQIRSAANGGQFANAGASATDRRWIDSANNSIAKVTLVGFDLQNYPGDTTEGVLTMKANGSGEAQKYLTLIRCTGMGTDVAGDSRIDVMVQNTAPDLRVINVVPADGQPIRLITRGLPAPFTSYDPTYYHLGDKVKLGNLWLRDNAGTLEKSTTGTGGWSAV